MNGEKVVWEEDLSFTFAEEYQALVKTIRFTEGFSLLFVECSPAQGTKIMEKIRRDIPRERAEVLVLDKTVYNFYNRVENLPNLKKIDILFVTGLENSLYEYEDEMRERGLDDNEIFSISRRGVPRVLINLNQQRERFRDNFDICFVFLLPRFGVDYLINRAPDFFDWRSGVFLFPMNKENFDEEFLKVNAKELDDYIELSQQECKDELLKIKSLLDEDLLPVEQKPNLLVRKAVINRKFNQNKAAILACDEALEIEPNNSKAWYNKGIALRNLDRNEEAFAVFENTLETREIQSDSRYKKAIKLINLGRYEEAIAAFDKAIEIKPDYYKAWNAKGIALRYLGRYKQAISAYDKAIEIEPNFHEAWYNKAIVMSDLERYKQAISAYDKTLEIKPNFYESWNNKGIALHELWRYEEAISAYDKTLEIKPDFYEAWSNKGVALRYLGRDEEAIAAFEKAIKIKPDFHYAWNGKGIALKGLGRNEEAISAYDKTLEIKPDFYYAWHNKAISLFYLGKYEQAIAACDKAIEIKPDYFRALYSRGILLWRLLRFKKGFASIMKGIQINPYSPVEIYCEQIEMLYHRTGSSKLKSSIKLFTTALRIIGLIS